MAAVETATVETATVETATVEIASVETAIAGSAAAPVPVGRLVRWHYFGYSAAAIVVMAVAIASHDRWFLNFVHVIAGVLWTGIDLFMGFVLGPILRRIAPAARREIITSLVPKTLFLMPTLSIVTGTAGYFLARDLGFLEVAWPQFAWVAAALSLVFAMTILGIGYLLPTNLRVCIELRRPDPDFARIAGMMRRFFLAVAVQGTMQVLTIVIMARFVAGL